MKSLYTKLSAQPVSTIEYLFKLERLGKHEESLEELKDIWEDVSTIPEVKDFDGRTAAEILLRCGATIGFLGQSKQIPGAQENSKNILTEARTRFLSIYEIEKVAECENYLALAYWRTNETQEAEAWIDTALARNLPDSNKTRLYTLINQSVVRITNKDFPAILVDFDKYETTFRKHGDAFLIGSFYTNYAIALKNLGNTSEALTKLELAGFYHQKSEHEIYLGTVKNNLAQLYKNEKRFVKAHEASDRASEIFNLIGDSNREGFSLETKAQIYFDEQKFAQSLETIEKAVKSLRRGENQSYLIEALMTKFKTLLFLDDFPRAMLCFTDAVQMAKSQSGEDAARKLIAEFELATQQKAEFVICQKAEIDEALKNSSEPIIELVLPPSLAHYKSVQGVWLSNDYLENIGLRKGSLAIVAETTIKRGDLAAIVEKETDSVICGFYDADFGVVCIERVDSEPQLFDENAVEILGKIVGVSNTGESEDGKMIVEEISF